MNWTLIAGSDGGVSWTTAETTTVMLGPITEGLNRITVQETLPYDASHRFHRLGGVVPSPEPEAAARRLTLRHTQPNIKAARKR